MTVTGVLLGQVRDSCRSLRKLVWERHMLCWKYRHFLRINQISSLVDTILFLLYTFPSVGIKELYLLCSFKYLSFSFNMWHFSSKPFTVGIFGRVKPWFDWSLKKTDPLWWIQNLSCRVSTGGLEGWWIFFFLIKIFPVYAICFSNTVLSPQCLLASILCVLSVQASPRTGMREPCSNMLVPVS